MRLARLDEVQTHATLFAPALHCAASKLRTVIDDHRFLSSRSPVIRSNARCTREPDNDVSVSIVRHARAIHAP
jgi:hypothetical protein